MEKFKALQLCKIIELIYNFYYKLIIFIIMKDNSWPLNLHWKPKNLGGHHPWVTNKAYMEKYKPSQLKKYY